MKKKIASAGVVCLMTVLMAWGVTAVASAADDISVSNIQPAYVEKGENNYTVTMRAFVTNNTPSETVTFEIVGVDKQGYQHQTITFSGNVPEGKTRVLMRMITIPKERYEQIDKWELKK